MTRICPDKDEPDTRTLITAQFSDGSIITDSFDYVLVAFPIHQALKPRLDLAFTSSAQLESLKMQQTNTYFVYGQLKLLPTLPTGKRLEVFSVDPNMPYRSIATQLPADYSRKKDRDLYVKTPIKLFKIFSDQELTNTDWDKVFENGYQLVRSIPWQAYPKYESKIDFTRAPPIILDTESRSRVLYLNALEWCASCMEMECVAARNLAILVARQEPHRVQNTKFFTRNESFLTRHYFMASLILIFISNLIYLIFAKFS